MNQLVQAGRLKKIREFLLEIIKDQSIDQLNTIPPGFNNNIIWHLGHLIAAQQGICYLRSGLPPAVDETYIQLYKTGTRPGEPVNAEEALAIKQTLISSIDKLEEDLQGRLFQNYITWTSRYGVELTSIDDALQFILFHEGLHSGCITYLKKLVSS